MENLKSLYEKLEKRFPEACSENLRNYCIDSEQNYTGLFSLKYIIYRLREKLSDTELFEVFRTIAENLIIYKKDCRREKLNRLPALKKYRKIIEEKIELSLNNFKIIEINGYSVFLNDSQQNLTAKIFRELPEVELIIFNNPETFAWGYIFKQTGTLIQKKQKEIYSIFVELSKNYSCEVMSHNNLVNLILNGGITHGYEKDGMTMEKLIFLAKEKFGE